MRVAAIAVDSAVTVVPPDISRASKAMADSGYSIRPSFAEKFRPQVVKALIDTVLKERLADKS